MSKAKTRQEALETATQPEAETAMAPKAERAKLPTATVRRGGWSWGGRVMRPGDTVTVSAAQIADWRAAGVVE